MISSEERPVSRRGPSRSILHLIRCRQCGNRDRFNVTTTVEVTVWARGRKQRFGPLRQTGSRWIDCQECGAQWTTEQKIETRDGWMSMAVWSFAASTGGLTFVASIAGIVWLVQWILGG